MGHNGLNTISEPISAKSPPPMDPPNRVAPHVRAVPDWETDGDRRRNGVPDRGAAEERAVDETPVDELIRELELDLEDELIAGGALGGAAASDPSDSCGANEDDYATVGVRNLEWRLPIIRSAAHRSADAIASIQLVEPSETQEEQLTRIVLSTYRLIDPRFRGSYFQQVRVGRTLPMVLQTASCVDGTPLSLQPTLGNDPTHSVRLFGHSIPVRANGPSMAVQRRAGSNSEIHRRSFPKISTQPIRTRERAAPARSKFRAEAIEVLAELQSRSQPPEWTRWFQGTRLIATLTVVTCVFVASIAAYRTALPLRLPMTSPQRVNELSRNNTTPEPPFQTDGKPATPSQQALAPQATSPETVPAVVPVTSQEIPLPGDVSSGSPARDRAVIQTDTPPAVTDPTPQPNLGQPDLTQPELTQAELMAALSRVTNTSDVDLQDSNPPASSRPLSPVTPPSFRESPPSEPTPSIPIKPNLPDREDGEPPDEALVASAVLTLWSETDSAAQKFTEASAADLIENWNLIADLAAEGSAEYLAAKLLVHQASWLIDPLAEIVDQLRSSDPSLSLRRVQSTDSELQNTSNLNADEVQRLYASWQAARARVVRTTDLNQMLRQANVLLDRIIISNQLSPSDRSNFLALIRVDVEKLTRISSDKAATADTASLLTAIATLPTASEWARLASAEQPSGLMASIYCLHQRRWDQGIAWLGQAGNLSVAAVAKAEWKLIESGELDADAQETLANRWSKIADRLEPREAAAVRLHALELYSDLPDTEGQKESLKAQLPQYLQ